MQLAAVWLIGGLHRYCSGRRDDLRFLEQGDRAKKKAFSYFTFLAFYTKRSSSDLYIQTNQSPEKLDLKAGCLVTQKFEQLDCQGIGLFSEEHPGAQILMVPLLVLSFRMDGNTLIFNASKVSRSRKKTRYGDKQILTKSFGFPLMFF